MQESEQPEAESTRRLDITSVRQVDRACGYSVNAPHGWEFLLDNHLENEEERRPQVAHVCVLGEN